MDTWATYLAMTGGDTARLVEDAGRARHREHLAAVQAAARMASTSRRWARWRRPTITVRPAAA